MNKLCAILLIIIAASCSPSLSPDHNWGNQQWVLTELKSVPVQLSGTRRDAYIEFSPADKRISGNAGCNRINGSYVLEKKNRINLGEIISTKMSCPDIAFENTFLSALKEIDRFEMKGTTLLFRKGKTTLLRFNQRAPDR